MSVVGYATMPVIPSFQGVKGQLERGISGPMADVGRTSGRRFGDSAGREAGSAFKGRFSGALKGFSPFAGIAVGAGVVALFKDAIDGASDLSESGNKINAVFGDAQGQVQDFAATASDSLGQTRLQALDAAATFGTFGKAAGLTGTALAGFSTELTSLATDMASFYNTDVATAIGAIGSGLRGEAEPLRQFGVLLDDATLRQEAMRQGLIKTTKEALTPQQKVLAAHAVILQQTGDAQGDFARTSDGLANQQRVLSAQWEEMKTALGGELLPAMTEFVGFLNDTAIPTLNTAGGLAKSTATGFGDLPDPVKSAALAMAGFAIAARLGVGPQQGVDGLRNSMQRLRDEAALQQALAGGITGGYQRLGDEAVTASGKLTRMQTASALTSRGLSSLRGAADGLVGMFGGPWGLALAGATVVVTTFWQEHQEAKQRVDELAASLDAQTGALTDNTRATVNNRLEKEGALEAAQNLGISLEDMTDAALGNDIALNRVRDRLREVAPDALDAGKGWASFNVTLSQTEKDGQKVGEALQNVGEDLDKAKESTDRLAQGMGDSTDATNDAADAQVNYADKIREAREEIRRLIDAEEKRRDNAVQAKRDQVALQSAMREAREEARKGRKTLDESTEAGEANWNALTDLADQWNTSKERVRNARGAYKEMRQTFIEVADEMGKTKGEAEKLADRWLKLPKHREMEITTPGIERAQRELKRLKELAEDARAVAITVHGTAGASYDTQAPGGRYATGGLIGGTGTGTSDSNLIWASRGEFMQREAAVNYYGVEFMRKLNNLQVPKLPGYAQGGLIQGGRSGGGAPSVVVHVDKVIAHDYDDFMYQMSNRARRAADGVGR